LKRRDPHPDYGTAGFKYGVALSGGEGLKIVLGFFVDGH